VLVLLENSALAAMVEQLLLLPTHLLVPQEDLRLAAAAVALLQASAQALVVTVAVVFAVFTPGN
jgi:hypothetical protein